MDIAEYNKAFKTSIKKALLKQLGHDFLIADRKLSGSFYHIFADALYEYEKGVILLERFYFIEKAEPTDVYYKKLNNESIEEVKKIKSELKNILSEHIIDSDSMKERQLKIDGLTERSKNIRIDAVKMQIYKYKGIPLARFDSYDDESIDMLSELYIAFAINATLFLGMQTLANYEVMISTIKGKDYVDLILVPVMQKE